MRTARVPDAVDVQKHHDLADDLLLGPGGCYASCPHWSDAIQLPEAVRLRFDDVEHLVPESSQQLLGVNRPDAPDHA
jgi:hypothetical protein